jgi:hypothetical protein
MQDNFDVNGDTELLTAYLDNELEPQERAALERRLVDDEQLRLELRSLRKAWELLDALPEITVSRDFTTTTMRMIAKVIAEEPLEKSTTRWSFFNFADRLSSGMLHTAVAVPLFLTLIAGGALAGYYGRKSAEKEQLNSMAAAAVLPTLKYFPDMEVAIALKDFPMLDLLAQTELSRSTLPVPPAKVENLTAWLDRLDPKDKELLRVREEDFKRQSEQDRSKYMSTWRTCAGRDDCASLQKTATLFAALLQTMESGKRAVWVELPKDEKVARLKEAAYYKIALWYADSLDPADSRAINDWFETELLPLLGEPREVWGWLIYRGSFDDLRLKNHEKLIELLIPTLTPKAREMIRGVSNRDRGVVLLKWIFYAEGVGNTIRTRSTDELIDVYLTMPDDVPREIVDLKDSGSAEWLLSRRYRDKKMIERNRKNDIVPKRRDNK